MEFKSNVTAVGVGVTVEPDWLQIGGFGLVLVLAGYVIYRLCCSK